MLRVTYQLANYNCQWTKICIENARGQILIGFFFIYFIFFTSTGVASGISRRITIHRFKFGRTFSPFSSTWTLAHSKKRKTAKIQCTINHELFQTRKNIMIVDFPQTLQIQIFGVFEIVWKLMNSQQYFLVFSISWQLMQEAFPDRAYEINNCFWLLIIAYSVHRQ